MTDEIFLNEHHQRSADSLAFRSVGMEVLDLERVTRHIQESLKRSRYPEGWPTDPMGYLLKRGGAVQVDDDQYPTVAGVLCFGHDPQVLLPDAVVDIGHYHGTQSVSDQLFHLEKGY